MITAALSAAVVGLFAFFGIRLSAIQITGVVVASKICVVLVMLLVGLKLKRKRDAKGKPAPND